MKSHNNTRLQHAKDMHSKIRDILMDDWDPIGIKQFTDHVDEYDSYIPKIYSLLIHRKTQVEMCDYLWWAGTENMGLSGNRAHTESVAVKLMALIE